MIVVAVLRKTLLVTEINRADFTDITCFCVTRKLVSSFMSFHIWFCVWVVRTKSTEEGLLIWKMKVFYMNSIVFNGFERRRSESWLTQTADESDGIGRWGRASMLLYTRGRRCIFDWIGIVVLNIFNFDLWNQWWWIIFIIRVRVVRWVRRRGRRGTGRIFGWKWTKKFLTQFLSWWRFQRIFIRRCDGRFGRSIRWSSFVI